MKVVEIIPFLSFQDYDNMSKEINSWMVISSTIDRVYFLSIAVFHIIIAAKGY